MSILGKGSMRDKEKVSRLVVDLGHHVTLFNRETFWYSTFTGVSITLSKAAASGVMGSKTQMQACLQAKQTEVRGL